MIDIFTTLAWTLGMALGSTILIYMLRITLIRNPEQMRRFLDRRFDVIRKANPAGGHCDYINRRMIKRWGLHGLLLIPLPFIGLR